MTQKEKKQLLLLELCSHLPYGVYIGDKYGNKWKLVGVEIYANTVTFKQTDGNLGITAIEEIRPYLRSLTSMTEEEKQYIRNRWCYEDWYDINDFLNHYQIEAGDSFYFIEWLYEHHFDFRNLIERKLAIEITEENNPYKNNI